MLEQNGDVLFSNFDGVCNSKCDFIDRLGSTNVTSRDVEMLRLIGQYLCDKGFNGSYSQLSKESGISLEHSDATELRHAILEGRWEDADFAIDKLASMINNTNNVDEVRFLLLEQQFLEHLEANEVMPAVTLLRNRITPMQRNTERVHTLASCLMCRTITELRAQAGGWGGIDSGSRLQLINRIQTFIPAQTMLPPRRLEELIDDALRAQLASCIFHNPPIGAPTDLMSVSLLQRHSCGMQDFPAYCIQTLEQRDSDLWLCQFSPDGQYLATGGKEVNVDIWRVDLQRHCVGFSRVLATSACVACISWSPNSQKLAACCGEEQSTVFVFDMLTGQQLCRQRVNDEDSYTTSAFFADSRKLAFGGLKGSFYIMDTEDNGRILTMVEGYRVQSMAAIIPPMPSILLPHGSESVQVNVPDRSTPGAPDSSMLTSRNESNLLSDSSNLADDDVDQLLIADSLHRIRLFRFGSLGNTVSNEVVNTSIGTSEASTTSASTIIVSTISGTSLGQTQLNNPSVTDATSLSSTASLAVYLSSGGVPGGPTGINISTSTSSTTESMLGASNNSSSGDNPAVAAALAVARLAQQQQQRLLQTNPTVSSVSSGNWYQHPYPLSANLSSYTSGSSTLPPGILLDMPILPVSLTRLTSPNTQGSQTQLGLQSVLQHSASSQGSNPYTVVTSPGGGGSGNLGSGSGGLTILFGAPLERSLASYVSTSIGITSTGLSTATNTPTGVRALAAAAAALASTNSRSYRNLALPAFRTTALTLAETGDAGRSTLAPSVSTTSTSTSTVENLTIGGSVTSAPTITSAEFVATNTGISNGNSNSNYGLLDHRTVFKETHPVQSITISRSGTLALLTLHKMGLHLWDLESCAILQRFIGHRQDTYRLHSTFGGTKEDFVATGSENGRIHIWHLANGSHPIHSSSSGNREPVTCVHWNPALPTMLASVNDAGGLCIWGPQRYTIGLGQPMDSS